MPISEQKMTWWRKNSSMVARLLILLAVWTPEVLVAYLAWGLPIYCVGGILVIIFLIAYGIVAGIVTLAIT